ncbi:hypothetical protein [Modicisalibacter luteus]|uniref:MFS transporter n=1 Tax=Modicisalibacter luteus TaxID=453962 RepID=A0ABV7M8J9_9GAMM|nr:hypothetical protein [Halomonas lutea]GHA98254.1 hypothetical protein GCM10007159_19820 [Halomonas lutea]
MQCYPAASAKATSSACSRPIAERLAISAGEFGIAYSSVTLIAGFVMLHFGPSIDWIAPRRFAMLVLAGLLTGIALLTLAPWAATALLGLGLVRLCGQGLFTHLGNTLTGREFSMNRGGLGMGMQEIIATGLLVNLWGSENLGRVRAPLSACMVFSTGIAPALLGLLVDAGVDFRAILAGMLVFIVLGWFLAQRPIAESQLSQ